MDYDVENFNGEIIPKLSTNYKIPLKIGSSNENGTALPEVKEVFSSPLLITEPPPPLVLPLLFAENNCGNNSIGDDNSRKRKPTPPPPLLEFSRKTTKIYGRDPSYPDALNELIQPLHCNLCDVRHNSVKTASVHYESKNHDKKVMNWLNEWAKNTGEPLPKVRKFVKEGVAGPGAYHCEICDLPLTSLQHASQHYNGKKHKMVVANVSNPSGSGFYDNAGKWVRTLIKIKTDLRYGIGESFVPPAETESTPKVAASPKPDQSKHCDICNISVTSEQQMEMHLKGVKHAKKLKILGKPPYATSDDTVLASVQAAPKNDISMYRTPTGNYYCKICNLTVTDPSDLTQHLNSKKHFKNSKKPIQDVPNVATKNGN